MAANPLSNTGTLNISVSDNEIVITGIDLREDLSKFNYLASSSVINMKITPTLSRGRKSIELYIKPELNIVSMEKVLIGLGMVIGRRPINVIYKQPLDTQKPEDEVIEKANCSGGDEARAKRGDTIVINNLWQEIARIAEANATATNAINDGDLIEWYQNRLYQLLSKANSALTQCSVRKASGEWEFHL